MTTSQPEREQAPRDAEPIGLRLIENTGEAVLDHIAISPDGRLALVTATVWPGGPLRLLQQQVGGLIERVALRDDLDAWVNEEGRLAGLPPNPVATAVCAALGDGTPPLPLPGTAVFLRRDGEDTTSLTPAQQRSIIDAWRTTGLRAVGRGASGRWF